jgi:hypothetical protein
MDDTTRNSFSGTGCHRFLARLLALERGRGRLIAFDIARDVTVREGIASPLPWSRTKANSMAITITVNGQDHSLDVEPDTPLLWALRDTLGLTGTRFGCGTSACGVHEARERPGRAFVHVAGLGRRGGPP